MQVKLRSMLYVALLASVATASSHVASIPVAGARVFPVQHAVNVVSGVILGPSGAVLVAFVAAVLRNLLGTGTLLAFPGGMIGALLAGLVYRKTKTLWLTPLGEIVGTGIFGATLGYPVARFLLGRSVAAFTYVVPFMMSSVAGAVLGALVVVALAQTPVWYLVVSAKSTEREQAERRWIG